MVIPSFALALPTSEWYLLLIVVGLFLVGIWLIYDEFRWSKQRAELYGKPPSRILRWLESVLARYRERSAIEHIPSETENRSTAVADVTPKKAA